MSKQEFWKVKSSILPSLEKEIEVDILIIGGGITGVSTAYHLIESNLKVALVEANTIGSGITSRTTGKLTYLQENIYSNIKKRSSIKKAKQYYESQREAINLVVDIINKNKIKCDLEEVTSYTFTNDSNKIASLMEEKELLKSFGAKILDCETLPNKEDCKYAIKAPDTYVFHPLKYLNGLKKIIQKNKIKVYEDTRIYSIHSKDDYYICKTAKAFIKAKKIVLALHYPYFLFPFLMPGKVTLEKSYIGAFEVPENLKFSAISVDKPVKSIRYHINDGKIYQFFLYGSRNISMNNNDKKNFSLLTKQHKSCDYLWSNIDIITGDFLPFIGKIDKNLFLGTGYNTWGMTNGSLAGQIISDLILEKSNSYSSLFNPKRGINLGKIIHFPVVLGSNVKSFVGEKLFPNKSWYKENIRFEKRNGKGVAIYKDEDGAEHIVYRLCPHLKCNLIFNEVEKTWDCPCHGSRFDIDGNCMQGPSNYNICYKEE